MKQKDSSGIIVSFDDVKMKHFRAYWLAVAKGNWAEQDKFFARVVKQWQWQLDPNDPNSYGELGVAEYKQVQNAIQKVSSLTLSNISNQVMEEKG